MAKKTKKNSHRQDPKQPDDNEKEIELAGVIEEALPGTLFRVGCDNGHKVLATLSGKLRIHHIRLLPGDQVVVAVSPYDLGRGRVKWRK